MQLVSVNLGSREEISHANKSVLSGIRKRPIAEPCFVGRSRIEDDVIEDLEHHGGTDQAVYAYSVEDYEWWSQQLDRELSPGLFGENFTISGMPTDMNVGDRLLIGEVVLEATAPRIPCATLATRLQDSGFGTKFRQAERPGVYFRVLNEGQVCAGDVVTFVQNDTVDVTILDLFRYKYANSHDEADLRRFLEAPIAERFRVAIENKLALLPS
ncbi:MAG: MOSC domain-containing protein [Gammaproteobacteria bacterium]|nr:MOSC domain-containing protein [Gammaproteobacteria bacterium]